MKILAREVIQPSSDFVDLVCGMTVNLTASETLSYQKNIYHFCSTTCLMKFRKNPSHYLSKKTESSVKKNEAIYTCPMHSQVQQTGPGNCLKELKLKAKTEFVIEVKCHRWNDGSQAEVLREFCREIGIKEVTHHQLRATHITLALCDGVPLGIVKENVGHAKLSTTDEYFRSAGINMKGQTDGLRIQVPQDGVAEVISLNKVK